MPGLPPVFVDGARVFLHGDPLPRVARIVQASGKAGQGLQVVRLRGPSDRRGSPVGLEDTIDRTLGPEPVYLRCEPVANRKASLANARRLPGKPTAMDGRRGRRRRGGRGDGDARERAAEANQVGRETRRGEIADRQAQQDGTQNPPPT